jgi:hypothetical protein
LVPDAFKFMPGMPMFPPSMSAPHMFHANTIPFFPLLNGMHPPAAFC